MMKWDDIIVRHFFIFFVECLDKVYVFRDRRDDDDIRSDKIFFFKSFTKELRIKLQSLFYQVSSEGIRLDEIIGLISILDDTVIFVHLFQRAHS